MWPRGLSNLTRRVFAAPQLTSAYPPRTDTPRELRIDGFLRKPYRPAELLELVQTLMAPARG